MSNDSDDLIIDLTELMDEEDSANNQTPEKPEAKEKTLKLETESFDLGRELSIDDQPDKLTKEELDFDKIFRESLDGITTPQKPKPEQPPKKDEQPFIFEESFDDDLAEKPLEQKIDQEFDYKPEEYAKPATGKPDIEAALESLKKDIPEIVESIARPIVSELITEVVSSVKKDLPGIIEKIIREEIEKLKKID